MSEAPKSIMRSLGEFFGHIARGVRTDPAEGNRKVVREETQEREGTTEDGQRVILRRTVVEEVEVLPEQGRADSRARGEAESPERDDA